VALLGSHFHAQQQAQLGDGRPRTVYLCLDDEYDPNRFFAEGGSAAEFSSFLAEARS